MHNTYLRAAGCLLLVLGGFLAGQAAARKAVLRRAALEQTLGLLQRLCQEVQYRHADLTLLYLRLCAEKAFPLLALAESGTFQTLAPPPWLTREEQLCFSECMCGAGRLPAAQECARLSYYARRMDAFRAEAAGQEARAKQAYERLGLGLGAMLALALL